MKQTGAVMDMRSSQNMSISTAMSTSRHMPSKEVCVTVAAADSINSAGR